MYMGMCVWMNMYIYIYINDYTTILCTYMHIWNVHADMYMMCMYVYLYMLYIYICNT